MKLIRTERTPKFIKVKSENLQFDNNKEDTIININEISAFGLKSNIVVMNNGNKIYITDKDSINTITNFLYNNLV